MKQLPSVWFDHRTDLPAWITTRIGQILVEWSVLERELEELIQMLLNTDIGFSRIITNRMNARTRVAAIYSLIEWYVYHEKLKPSFLADFDKIGRRVLEATQNKRDIVAHGVWSRIKGNWEVLKLRGQRQTPQLRPELKRLTRALLPQRELITKDKLNETIKDIISDARAIDAFRERVYRVLSPEQVKYVPLKYTRRRRRNSVLRHG